MVKRRVANVVVGPRVELNDEGGVKCRGTKGSIGQIVAITHVPAIACGCCIWPNLLQQPCHPIGTAIVSAEIDAEFYGEGVGNI